MHALSMRLSRSVGEDLGDDEGLAPILPSGTDATMEQWLALRKDLLSRWRDFLGEPCCDRPDGSAELVDEFETPWARGKVFRQPTGRDSRQLAVVMEPKTASRSPRPAAIVPYYHPDAMAGFDLAGRELIADRPLVQFGRHLTEQGYVTLCVEAFPFNTTPEPEVNEGFAWWQAATDKVLADNPRGTGMGKLVWDTRLATDLLLAQPDIDAERVVAIGHSLGGKMAFYCGCLDERIRAVIASDFGVGYPFTNWDAPWYLGPKIHDPNLDLAHHQLLALMAPRSLLVIAGRFDRPASRQYLNEARKVYDLHGRGHALGIFNHATGHQPTEESIRIAYKWLAEQFGLPEPDFRA